MKKRGLTRFVLAALLCGLLAGQATALGKDNILHPLQAETFSKELQTLSEKHGGLYVGSGADKLPHGLLSAHVVDFDADGQDELLMVYRSKETGECYYKMMTYADGAVKTLREEKISGDSVRLATSGDKIYLITNATQPGDKSGQLIATESYNTIVDGLFNAETVFGTDVGGSGCYINGQKVEQQEYNSKRAQYTKAPEVALNGHQSGLTDAQIEAHRFALTGTLNQVKQAVTPPAIPTATPVYVNFEMVSFDAYNINGSNYFKIRDIAYMINGTAKQFSVSFDNVVNAVTISTGKPYESNKTEMLPGDGLTVMAALSKQTVLLNGAVRRFEAYNINGSNYFKLRDLGQALDFGVVWNDTTGAIEIRTQESYQP